MKVILSRKGFDSSIGKVPSPIFDSGKQISLPIPEIGYNECARPYSQIMAQGASLGSIVCELTQGRIEPETLAHLDPDLDANSLHRPNGWKPIFGQAGAAETHLRNNGIGNGDVFLFFGWFRQVEVRRGKLRYVRNAPDLHVIFGWLQVGRRIAVTPPREELPDWAHMHPHCKYKPYNKTDCIYTAMERLTLPGYSLNLPGGGVFERFHPSLCLTANKHSRGIWRLPKWFYPKDKSSGLSYHGDLGRWQEGEDHVLLKTVGRGQEFVLDTDDYPEAVDWIADVLALSKDVA